MCENETSLRFRKEKAHFEPLESLLIPIARIATACNTVVITTFRQPNQTCRCGKTNILDLLRLLRLLQSANRSACDEIAARRAFVSARPLSRARPLECIKCAQPSCRGLKDITVNSNSHHSSSNDRHRLTPVSHRALDPPPVCACGARVAKAECRLSLPAARAREKRE